MQISYKDVHKELHEADFINQQIFKVENVYTLKLV